MTTRIKKLFHHKTDDEDTPDSPTREKDHFRRFSRSDKSKPSLRQSMDESGVAGESSPGMVGRQSGTYARSGPPQIGDLGYASTSAGHQDGRLSSEFSKLNLDGSPSYRSDSYPSAQPAPGQAQHYGNSPSRNATGIRRVGAEDPLPQSSGYRSGVDEGRNNYPTSSTINTYDPTNSQHQTEHRLSRPTSTSIPRKEVGSGTAPPETTSSNTRQSTLQKPLPPAPHGAQGSSLTDSSGISGPSHVRNGSRSVGEKLTAEEVLSRARENTANTTVIEKIAPAVVHETVNNEIHHIRQEVITREIHDHEYYHRILPIVDVEVLPTRHFLPVEGGGLVEINSDEIPGRSKNWVIAETASKIPSGEPFTPKPNVFSARKFVGKEGDEKKCMTEEGYERTEQTWVHPPELETGARETGQSWPMEFEGREGQVQGQGQTPRQTQTLGQSQGLGQNQTVGQTQGLGQTQLPSQTRYQTQTPSQTRSPIKDAKKKKGILKNATPQPAVDERIDSPGGYSSEGR